MPPESPRFRSSTQPLRHLTESLFPASTVMIRGRYAEWGDIFPEPPSAIGSRRPGQAYACSIGLRYRKDSESVPLPFTGDMFVQQLKSASNATFRVVVGVSSSSRGRDEIDMGRVPSSQSNALISRQIRAHHPFRRVHNRILRCMLHVA